MPSINVWLDEYSQSHRHPLNKTLHWICVPPILFAVMGLIAAIPAPAGIISALPLGWASLACGATLAYYARLSMRLALGMLPVFVLFGAALHWLAASAPLWLACLGIFGVAWIGQFIGHAIEGRRPSFFKDLQFLLIGPLWLLGAVYRRLGLGY